MKLVYNRMSQESRGFGFIYFNDVETATKAKEETNGIELDGKVIRVDYSLTEKEHEKTPGYYAGRRDQIRDRPRYRSPPRRRSRSPPRYYRRRSRSPPPYDRRRSPPPFAARRRSRSPPRHYRDERRRSPVREDYESRRYR